jgi:hypothetical protein
MPRVTVIVLCGLVLGLAGCKEKTELRELCAAPTVGERSFTSESLGPAVAALRRAEEAEEIATNLEKKRQGADERRLGMLQMTKTQRAAAEAMPLDDKDARRKAILEVTAQEQEAQKLSDEIAKYHVDIERNQESAKKSRQEARRLLTPLLRSHGMTAEGCAVLTAPAPKASK